MSDGLRGAAALGTLPPVQRDPALDAAIGARVAALRALRGVSAAELDARLGWESGTAGRVEAGERPVTIREAPRLARALEVSIQELLRPSHST